MTHRGLDPAPLLAHLEVASMTGARHACSNVELGTASVREMARELAGVVDIRTIHRWRRGGRVAPHLADRCAIALGLHPVLLWPDFHR